MQKRDVIPSVEARLADLARQKEKRRRLLELLQRLTPIWNPADHPDIEKAGGTAGWVRKLRRETDKASMRRVRPTRG